MRKTHATNPPRERRSARRFGRTVAAATIAAAATVALAAGPASAAPTDVPGSPGGPVAGVVQAAVTAVTPAPAVPTLGMASSGIDVLSMTTPDSRTYSLQLTSTALGGRAVNVQVVVPPKYDPADTTTYPSVYLMHGANGGGTDWTDADKGNVEAATANMKMIVVMPDAGFERNGGGWYTNWIDQTTKFGPSQWETFHITQLIPYIDSVFRTNPSQGQRAIAGISEGGFGAMSYAARHSDKFAAAASFSGAPDIDRDVLLRIPATVVIEQTARADGVNPSAAFGPRSTNEANWQQHDPANAAQINSLRGMNLALYTAAGVPSSNDLALDKLTSLPAASAIELLTHLSTEAFHQHLQDAGVPSYFDDSLQGTHTWQNWANDLTNWLPRVQSVFDSNTSTSPSPVMPAPVAPAPAANFFAAAIGFLMNFLNLFHLFGF